MKAECPWAAAVWPSAKFGWTTAGSNGISSFNYTDANGLNSNLDFNYAAYGISNDKLTDIRAFRVAMPQYVVRTPQKQMITVTNNGNSFSPELAEDINNIAVNVLKERFVTELANALARQITKKLMEKGTEAVTESIAKSNNNKDDKNKTEEEKEKEKQKKERKAKTAGEVAGFLTNIVNTVTEKADTRNWQSLPAYVSYVRIPLSAGENIITVTSNGKPMTLKVNGGKGLQMMGMVVE